jgi:hypothetical protein
VLRWRARHRDDHPAGLTRTRAPLALWAAAALAAALPLAGCGGDGDDGSGARAQDTSKREFVTAAIRVCATSQSELQRVYALEFAARTPSDSELVRFTRRVAIPNVASQFKKLLRLPVPEQDRATVERYFEAYVRGVEQLRADPAVVTRPPHIPPAFEQANRLATDLGIPQCVR